jgi:cytochrome c oxidase cbb3-type subunit 2
MMPAFSERLDEMQIRILTAWLMNSGEENLSTSEVIKPKEISSQANKDLQENSKFVGTESSDAELGKQVYEKYCIACHQASGKGLPGTFPSLVGNEAVLLEDASQHIEVVLNGLKDKVIEGVTYAVPMPGFGGQLNDQEVAAVINHERSQWGNDAARITGDAVAKFR